MLKILVASYLAVISLSGVAQPNPPGVDRTGYLYLHRLQSEDKEVQAVRGDVWISVSGKGHAQGLSQVLQVRVQCTDNPSIGWKRFASRDTLSACAIFTDSIVVGPNQTYVEFYYNAWDADRPNTGGSFDELVTDAALKTKFMRKGCEQFEVRKARISLRLDEMKDFCTN